MQVAPAAAERHLQCKYKMCVVLNLKNELLHFCLWQNLILNKI